MRTMRQKRLGAEKADALVALLEQQPPALAEVASALLTDYYDAMYEYQAGKRAADSGGGGANEHHLKCETGAADAIAELVLSEAAAHAW